MYEGADINRGFENETLDFSAFGIPQSGNFIEIYVDRFIDLNSLQIRVLDANGSLLSSVAIGLFFSQEGYNYKIKLDENTVIPLLEDDLNNTLQKMSFSMQTNLIPLMLIGGEAVNSALAAMLNTNPFNPDIMRVLLENDQSGADVIVTGNNQDILSYSGEGVRSFAGGQSKDTYLSPKEGIIDVREYGDGNILDISHYALTSHSETYLKATRLQNNLYISINEIATDNISNSYTSQEKLKFILTDYFSGAGSDYLVKLADVDINLSYQQILNASNQIIEGEPLLVAKNQLGFLSPTINNDATIRVLVNELELNGNYAIGGGVPPLTTSIVGGRGNDTLIGGEGDFVLNAGQGDDVYVIKGQRKTTDGRYVDSDFNHHITDTGGINTIDITDVFDDRQPSDNAGYNPYELTHSLNAQRNGQSLLLMFDGNRVITIDDFFTNTQAMYQLKLDADNILMLDRQQLQQNADLYNPQSLLRIIGGGQVYKQNLVAENITGMQSVLWGAAGNDTLKGTQANDILYGGSGNDWLVGGEGDDILHAGKSGTEFFGSYDTLEGGLGNDIYITPLQMDVFGEGGVTVIDANGLNTLDFSALPELRKSIADITGKRQSDSLYLNIYTYSQEGFLSRSITIQDYFISDADFQFKFVDGSLLALNKQQLTNEADFLSDGQLLLNIKVGTTANEYLTNNYSSAPINFIVGGGGNDDINGSNNIAEQIIAGNGFNKILSGQNDTVFGGNGYDYIVGTGGIVDAGDGVDDLELTPVHTLFKESFGSDFYRIYNNGAYATIDSSIWEPGLNEFNMSSYAKSQIVFFRDNASLFVNSTTGDGLSLYIRQVFASGNHYVFILADATISLSDINFAPYQSGAVKTLNDGIEDNQYVISASDLIQGFSDYNNDSLIVWNLSANNGLLTDNQDGTYTFNPNTNFNGTVNLTYQISDSKGETTGSISNKFYIQAVNDVPVGVPPTLADGKEDTPYIISYEDLKQNYYDVEGDPIFIMALTSQQGTITDNFNGTFTFTPNANYFGSVAISYLVNDELDINSAQQQVLSFNLEHVNNDPMLSGNKALLADGEMNKAYIVNTTDLLKGFTDQDGDVLSVVNLKADKGALVDNGNGTYTITPESDYIGSVALSYDVIDGKGGIVNANQLFDIYPTNKVQNSVRFLEDNKEFATGLSANGKVELYPIDIHNSINPRIGFDAGLISASVGFSASVDAKFGTILTVQKDGKQTADIDYRYDIETYLPQLAYAGSQIEINTAAWNTYKTLSAEGAKLDFSLDLAYQLDVGLSANYKYKINYLIGSKKGGGTIFKTSIGTNGIKTLRVADVNIQDGYQTVELFNQYKFSIEDGSTNNYKIPNLPLEVNVGLPPTIDLKPQSTTPTSTLIYGQGAKPFISFGVDVDQIIGYFFGFDTSKLTAKGKVLGTSYKVELFDLDLLYGITNVESLKFTPNDIMVEMTSSLGEVKTGKLGSSLLFSTPQTGQGNLDFITKYYLDGELLNQKGVNGKIYLDLKVLNIAVDGKGFSLLNKQFDLLKSKDLIYSEEKQNVLFQEQQNQFKVYYSDQKGKGSGTDAQVLGKDKAIEFDITRPSDLTIKLTGLDSVVDIITFGPTGDASSIFDILKLKLRSDTNMQKDPSSGKLAYTTEYTLSTKDLAVGHYKIFFNERKDLKNVMRFGEATGAGFNIDYVISQSLGSQLTNTTLSTMALSNDTVFSISATDQSINDFSNATLLAINDDVVYELVNSSQGVDYFELQLQLQLQLQQGEPLSINLSGLSADATLQLFNQQGDLLKTSTADQYGYLQMITASLASGQYYIKVTTAVNPSGYLLAVDATYQVESASAATLADGQDSGISNSDLITNITTPVLKGTAQANVTVSLYDGTVKLGEVVANHNGEWLFTSPSLLDGEHIITTRAQDSEGNLSNYSQAFSFVIDSQTPIQPTLEAIEPIYVEELQAYLPELSGMVETGTMAFLSIYDSQQVLLQDPFELNVDDNSYWQFILPELADGDTTLRISSVDVAGNISFIEQQVTVVNYDELEIAQDNNQILLGTEWFNAISFAQSTSAITIDLSNHSIQSTGFGNKTFISIEGVVGSTYNDHLIGSNDSNVLDGGLGVDTLEGGAGDDIYIIDNLNDVVIEQADGGIDSLVTYVDYALTDESVIENIGLLGTAISAVGNNVNNMLIGNSLSNNLLGLAGNDTLIGHEGDDVLDGGDGEDLAVYFEAWSHYQISLDDGIFTIEDLDPIGLLDPQEGSDIVLPQEGIDTVLNIESIAFNFDSQHVVSLIDALNDAPIAFDDNNSADSIIEKGASILGDNQAIGNVLINDQDADLSLGLGELLSIKEVNGLSNSVGINVEGVYGAIVINSDGSYTYTLNDLDVDTMSLIDGQMAVDSFMYTVTDVHGVSASASLNIGIQGSNDVITGTSGADTLIGTLGDDTYVVNHQRDLIIELLDGGIDTLEASVSYMLSDNLENLTLTGNGNLSATGNSANNIIRGNNGKNRLLGAGGNDLLYGLSESDTLNGGAGIDTMSGGLGNDIFTVENIDDLVVEFVNEGYDSVNSFVTYTLTENVDRLNLENSGGKINGFGNDLDNTLNGNNFANWLVGGMGNDVLQGKGGTDTLEGGLGDDIYHIDNVGDIVTELASQGTDKVSSTISYTLTENVEQLYLTGISGLSGTGNGRNNIIYGNSGNNLLSGDAGNDSLNGGLGNDSLDGGQGNDTLVGGLGDDIYLLGIGSGRDLIDNKDNLGNDILLLSTGITTEQVWLRQLGNDLEVSIIGTTNSSKVKGWYGADSANKIDSIELTDGHRLLANDVQALVEAMAVFTSPSSVQTVLTNEQKSILMPIISQSWS